MINSVRRLPRVIHETVYVFADTRFPKKESVCQTHAKSIKPTANQNSKSYET